MEEMDLDILEDMMVDYSPVELMRGLRNLFQKQADELVDAQLNDKAKDFTLAAHHLSIFVGE